MGKSSFSGYDPGLPSGKSSPASNVDFSNKGKDASGKWAGVEDSRPRNDDNRPGANRWPMGENKQIDGDKKRFANQKNIGKGPSGL